MSFVESIFNPHVIGLLAIILAIGVCYTYYRMCIISLNGIERVVAENFVLKDENEHLRTTHTRLHHQLNRHARNTMQTAPDNNTEPNEIEEGMSVGRMA
jgi:regulator of replication initiation timing